MHVSQKSFGWICFAVIASYMAVVALGFFMPLQSDEISGLFLNHRAILDNHTTISLVPQCGRDAFSHPLPLIWYPPAYASYFTFGNITSPFWLRTAGILEFLLWLTLLIASTVKLFALPVRLWWAALAVILGLLGWDAVPLVLLVSRPEQILLIGTVTAMFMMIYAGEFSRRPLWRILATLFALFIILCMHASHPKAIALLPFELVCYGVFLRRAWGGRAVCAAGLALLAWIAFRSYAYDILRVQCPSPDAAEIKAFFDSLYLPVQLLWQSPKLFALKAIKDAIASPIADFYLDIYFHVGHIWLPLSIRPINGFTNWLIQFLDVSGWFIHFALLLIACGACISAARRILRKETLEHKELWLGLSTLLLFIGAIFVLLTEGIFYSVSLMIPLTLLAGVLGFGLLWRRPWSHALVVKIALVILAGSIANQALLLYRYGDLAGATGEEAYDALKINHLALTPAYDYDKKRDEILALAQQCHMGTGPETKHVALDDLTYYPFRRTSQPFYFQDSTGICCHRNDTGQTGWAWFDAPRYLQMLQSYDSDGVIARCALFPKGLRALAIERSGFCCLPKASIPHSGHPKAP